MHMAKGNKIGNRGDNYEDEMIKRSPFKNLKGAVEYLTLKTRLTFTKAPFF